MPPLPFNEKLRHRDIWTLREIKQALAQTEARDDIIADIGSAFAVIRHCYGATALPELRQRPQSAYSCRTSYEKRVDRMISKYGPDARFRTKPRGAESGRDYSIKPTEENINEDQLTPSEEPSPSSPENRDVKEGPDHPSPDNPGLGHRDGRGSEGEGRFLKWDISLGGDKPGARHSAEPPSPQTRDNACSAPFEGNKVGFGSPLDATDSVSKEVATSSDRSGPSKGPGQSGKYSPIFRPPGQATPGMTLAKETSPKKLSSGATRYDGSSDSGTLGEASSPLKPLSFDTFALSGAKGQRAWGLSNPSTKVKLSDLIGSETLSSGLDESWLKKQGSGLSREDKFRDGSPGGYVDKNKAELEKKSVKSQARKIARHFVGFFRDNEIGIGAEQTPRINGKKLVKELIGKATRLGQAKKEEKGTGLKLILVDISPSCEAIRDACFAAALAIADQDPNVVVIAHFNGYTAKYGGHIIGHRQKEVPHIRDTDDLEKFEAWLAKGKVSGAVCFGDDDARSVYAVLSCYCPTLWMSPYDEEHCRWALDEASRNRGRAYKEARMYIVGGVNNAQSAVEGLKKLKKGN